MTLEEKAKDLVDKIATVEDTQYVRIVIEVGDGLAGPYASLECRACETILASNPGDPLLVCPDCGFETSKLAMRELSINALESALSQLRPGNKLATVRPTRWQRIMLWFSKLLGR